MKKQNKQQKTGAQALVDSLAKAGTEVLFGYPGGQVTDLFDALYQRRDKIRFVLTAHEQGAAHAADGYARASGRVGTVMATSGPGATNLVTGIAAAYLDSVPVVAVTGNVPCDQIGRDSFQEVDILGVSMPVTKHNFIVKDIRDLAETVREAYRIAKSGRPGPVLVDIPKDVQQAKCEFTPAAAPIEPEPLRRASEHRLARAAEMIAEARKPYIYFGGGAVRTELGEDIVKLADKLDAPILLTAKDSIPRETTNAIEKLGAKKAVILGGTGAVSVQVESILRDNDITTERIAGATRFGTAAEIAKRVNDKPAEVFFVYAGDYPDALSVSSVAARKNAPVLYLPTNGRIDAATQQYLDSVKGSVKNAYVIGGDGVISDAVMQNAADATGLKTNETLTRVAGRNRYLTNLAVNYTFADVLTSNSICTATGKDFPDALAGGVLAAQKGAPILLVSDDLIEEQSDYLAKRAAIKVYVHGGTAAVSDELAHKIAKAA